MKWWGAQKEAEEAATLAETTEDGVNEKEEKRRVTNVGPWM